MQIREIGRSGIRASAVGLGTWAIGGWMWGGTDEDASVAAIRAAIDAGVSLIDTAPAYGMGRSEEIVGKAIAGRRDEVVLATKCGLVWHTDRGNHFFDQAGTTGAPLPGARLDRPRARRRVCAASAPTTSTSTSPIGRTRRRRSPRPWTRWRI